MHFPGFIIRIYHDARPSECQIRQWKTRLLITTAFIVYIVQLLYCYFVVRGEDII